MVMEMFIHDRLLILSLILLAVIFLSLLIVILRLQKNKKNLVKNFNELNELSEIIRKKEYAIQGLQDSSVRSEKYLKIISREIKKPLNSFIDLSDVLLDEFDFLSNDEKVNYIKQLNEGINTAKNKFQNIFYWINYKLGQYNFIREQIDIAECVGEVKKLMSSLAHRKKVSIETDIEPGLRAYADINMLNTILRNLLFNALEYSPVNSKVLIQAFNTAGTIKISVQDFGCGINDTIKNLVFSDNTKKFSKELENDYSSGLGLLLIKEFVSKNGGELWLDTEVNMGSKFTFTLPKAETNSNQ